MPGKAYQSAMSAAGPTADERADRQAAITERIRRERSERWSVVNAVDSFVLGAADTLTFGFMDEISANLDHYILGKDYETSLMEARGFMQATDEQDGAALLTGQIAGGLVPYLGWGSRSVRGMAISGAAYGGLYGLGSDEGDFTERLDGALTGATIGGIGGYVLGGYLIPAAKKVGSKAMTVLRRGKVPELDAGAMRFDFDEVDVNLTASAPDLKAPKPTAAAPSAAPKINPVFEELEDGALVSAKELLGDPAAARKAIETRIGKLSEEEAAVLMRKIEDAELNGRQFENPHYRSLLKIDAGDMPVTKEQIAAAAELFEEATERLAKKAGLGKKSLVGMERDVAKELRKGLTLSDAEAAYNKTSDLHIEVRKMQHIMWLSANRLVKLREEMLPKLLNGEEGVREQLAEKINEFAQSYTFARGTLSNAGRGLGILSHGTNARNIDITDQLSEAEIKERIFSALNDLGDDGLKALLGRIKRMDQAEDVFDTLLDPKEAQAFTTWQRTMNSVSLFLRSNALTPATGLFNAISLVSHDYFRNDLTRRVAAKALEKAGKMSEATALRFEAKAARAVYWEAHKKGIKALFNRVKWEYWTDVERIASVGWGSGKVAAKARLKRETMLSNGYAPNVMREFDDKPRLAVTDLSGFNARLEAQRAEGGALANLIYHAERARAVTGNTLDAVGGASMKLFTAALDDWGREFIRVKETFAQATRFAVKEAYELGVPTDKVGMYVQARATELAEMPNSELMDRVEAAMADGVEDLKGEAAFLRDIEKLVNDEAEKVLFMDGPQTTVGKTSANFLSSVDRLGIVFPYVRTPIRLFEQGVVNYGPFGKMAPEIRKIIQAGGVEAELAKARVEVGATAFNIGIGAGLAGAITATNGGFQNSANLDAGPPNRLNLPGGGFVEISRLDPFAYTIGMGAIIGQALREGFAASTEADQMEAIRAALATTIMGTFDVVLNKSYMKGLQEALEAVSGAGEGNWSGLEKVLQNTSARLIPVGGISRQINETFRESAIESVGWVDTILRHIPGAGWGMAPRIDPLGDEIKGRTAGLNFGNSELTEGRPISPVKKRLRELGIDINTLRKSDPDGFDLTSEELSEVRRIRGKEALNDEGQTMEEALAYLFDDPWFQSLPTKDQKRAQVVETMAKFNKPAWEILNERNPTYAGKKAYTKSLADYIAQGMTEREASANAKAETEALGLPTP